MRRYILWGLAILLVGAGIYFLFARHTTTPPAPGSVITFPNASSTNPDGSLTPGGTTGGTMVASQISPNGIETNDFIHNGTTVQDAENPGQYYLAGSIGYCTPDGVCPTGAPSDEYHIVYFSQDRYFVIALLQEPLGKARLDAEQFLQNTLGINKTAMCAMKYYLSTQADTNANYAGKNLLFSFCPGATPLPN